MPSSDFTRMRSAERTMLIVRAGAVPFGLVQVLTYYMPYPDQMLKALGLAIVGLLALGNVLIYSVYRKADNLERLYKLGIAALAFDFLIVFGFVFLYTFDVNTTIFILLYVVVLEGAIRFRKKGAMLVIALATLVYTLRELFGYIEYEHPFLAASISFRMGVGMMIAAVAGAMASRFEAERQKAEKLYLVEHEKAQALKTVDELKDNLLISVGHEFRTPLTSILGFAITLTDHAKNLDQTEKVMLSHIVIEAEKLSNLFDDLLDVERLAQGISNPCFELADVSCLVRKVATSIQSVEHEILLPQNKVQAKVDPTQFERMAKVLISNAVRYSAPGSTIEITCSQEDSYFLLCVNDTGAGVPDDMKKIIFEPFRRGLVTNGHSPGTGIGLALVDHIAQAHQGKAWVVDNPGGGSSFRVKIPS